MRTFVLLTALLTAGCAYHSPAAPTPPPVSTAPATIQITSTPAIGPQAQSAAIVALVSDAAGRPVADQMVTFTTSAGTLTPSAASTDARGAVRVLLLAPSGSVQIAADAQTAHAETFVAVQSIPVVQAPTPSAPPTPIPDPLTVLISAFTTYEGPFAGGLPLAYPVRFVATVVPLETSIRSFAWTFGDDASSTSSARTVDHKYATAAGWMNAHLTVTAADGRTAQNTIQIQLVGMP